MKVSFSGSILLIMTAVILTAAAVILATARPAFALELSEGLALDGSKVISYKMSSHYAESNRVDQNLKVNLKGNINESLVTDLKIDDSLAEKVEKMYFEYNRDNMNVVLGDLNFSPVTRFGASEKKMRGFMANIANPRGMKDGGLTLMYTFENGRPEKETFRGEGRMGPFKLACDKIIPQSDRVYIDAVLKNRNIDYGVDYDNGILTFNEEVPLGAEISVLYSAPTGFDNLNRHSFGAFAENDLSRLGATRVGFVRTEERLENSFESSRGRTEFNLNQDIRLNERVTTNLEYSRSFKDSSDSAVSPGDGSGGGALALNTRLAARHFDTNLRFSSVEPAYTPYHNGYIRAGKKSEVFFDIHPGGAGGGKLNGTVGIARAAQPGQAQDASLGAEEKLFGRLFYNLSDNMSVNTNFQNGSAGDIKDLKFNARSSKVNFENGITRQKTNGGADELASVSLRASSAPVNRNVYFVEYNDSSLKSYSKVKDENNDFNFKLKRKISELVSMGYSLIDSSRRNMAEAESKAVENRVMLDYNHGSNLSLAAQAAVRGEERTAAFEPSASMKGALLGAKFTPADFVKLLVKREIWDSEMLTRGMNFTKIEDSARIIIAWPEKPYSLELKNYTKTPEYDLESGAPRGKKTSNGAEFNIKAGSKLKFTSELSRSVEDNSLSPKTNIARQEVKYKVNDDIDFFLKVEREKSFISNISSIFRLEAKL